MSANGKKSDYRALLAMTWTVGTFMYLVLLICLIMTNPGTVTNTEGVTVAVKAVPDVA